MSDLSTTFRNNRYMKPEDLFDRYAEAREIMRLDIQIEGNLIINRKFETGDEGQGGLGY